MQTYSSNRNSSMNTHRKNILISLILSSLPFFCSAGEITIGTSSCPVHFEDSEVSAENQNFLVGQMDQFFKYADSFRAAFNSSATNSMGFYRPVGSYSLTLPKQVRKGILYTSTPSNLIQVTSSFSQYYLSDTNRLDHYLASFAGITNFLENINSGAITNQTMEAIRAAYYFTPAVTEDLSDSAIIHATETHLVQHEYFSPTLFDFELIESTAFNQPLPSFIVRYREKGNAAAEVRCRPVVFIDNHWAFWME